MAASYTLLERLFPTDTTSISPFRKTVYAVLQLVADTLFLDTFYVLSAYSTSHIIEGFPIRQLARSLRSDFPACLKASLMSSAALSPLEIANFRFVRKEWRTVVMNFTDVVWNAVNSLAAHKSRALQQVEGCNISQACWNHLL